MLRFDGRRFLVVALTIGFLAIFSLLRHPRHSSLPLDDWDVPQVIAQLHQQGLHFHPVSVQKDGPLSPAVYLTTTEGKWAHYNRLFKDPSQIEKWRGTLYCERRFGPPWREADAQYGDCYFIVGPFFFFGDRELLAKVRTALSTSAGPPGSASS